jgi:hypothetical protein
MNRSIFILSTIVICLAGPLRGQVPDPVAPPGSGGSRSRGSSAPARSSSRTAPTTAAQPAGSSFLGKDIPVFNPGTEIMAWDGKHWNINNQRFFQARFEKYLNAPEETDDDDKAYQLLVHTILQKLAPAQVTAASTMEAWRLLPRASNYKVDAHLCDSLADSIYSAWMAKRNQNQLLIANQELGRLRRQHEWNAQMSGEQGSISDSPGSGKGSQNSSRNAAREMRVLPHLQRLAEVNARIKGNEAKRLVSEIQTRIEFQALMIQFFLQRRFQHVIMAARFYRQVFNDGDTSLKVEEDTKELFTKSTGMPPTVSTLDSLAHEAMRDVQEGVDAYKFLLSKNELESATKRLSESFIVGEYMPEIRTLPRDQKRRALEFTQKANRLLSALEVRDFTLAEQIVTELEKIAKDFDTTQPRAAIETARTVSLMHLAKAKNAAIGGDKETLEAELREATTIWPRNPALADVTKLVFAQADIQQQAVADLDRLLSQKNYRQIFDDKLRYIAATAVYPERQEQLKKVLDDMQTVEATIMRCHEISKRGDYAGAWESAERTAKQFPDDTKLSQLRANLTTEAADFVRSIRTAQQLEQKNQIGSSLAWYLKAQKTYPPSDYAQEGIRRLVQNIIPKE